MNNLADPAKTKPISKTRPLKPALFLIRCKLKFASVAKKALWPVNYVKRTQFSKVKNEHNLSLNKGL